MNKICLLKLTNGFSLGTKKNIKESIQAAFSTNAKKILVNVVPKKAHIKNFIDDDPRLP